MKNLLIIAAVVVVIILLMRSKKQTAVAPINPFDAGVTTSVYGHTVTVYNHPDADSLPGTIGINTNP